MVGADDSELSAFMKGGAIGSLKRAEALYKRGVLNKRLAMGAAGAAAAIGAGMYIRNKLKKRKESEKIKEG